MLPAQPLADGRRTCRQVDHTCPFATCTLRQQFAHCRRAPAPFAWRRVLVEGGGAGLPLLRQQSSRLRNVCCSGSKAAAASAAAAAAAQAAAPPCPPPTQDPQVIYHAIQQPIHDGLVAPVAACLGGEASWRFYLAARFATEVLAVVVACLVGYWAVSLMAKRSAEPLEPPTPASGAGAAGKRATASSSSAGGSSGELFAMAAEAITGPWARGALAWVLAINMFQNSMNIFDAFITKFNPTLPTDWLDDLVRLLVQSMAPLDDILKKLSLVTMGLFGCAVAVRWKDILLAHYLVPRVESLDKGQEIVQSFVSPASTLFNWVAILASGAWLATALGVNLKPMLAVGGASGIIIGLATQQVLSNFVSGLNIFLARPFVAGEYISLVSQTFTNQAQISGRVIRVDPMRTLIATEDSYTITVPNQIIAVSIVVNRTRSPHWSVGQTSPLLANPRELRWRMKLPHTALDKIQELESRLVATLDTALPDDKVRFKPFRLTVVKLLETGAEVSAKVNLVWRLGPSRPNAHDLQERMELQEALLQGAMLSLQKVVRSFDGALLTAS